MSERPPAPTAEEGHAALRQHVVQVAAAARERRGVPADRAAVEALLDDRAVVRFPTRLRFDAGPLELGEFAWARQLTGDPADGFDLVVHPALEDDPRLPLAVAYHLPSINWLEVVTHVEAELFGATLLDLDVDDYYARLCALADGLPGAGVRLDPPPRPEPVAAAGGCGGGGSCGCGQADADPAAGGPLTW